MLHGFLFGICLFSVYLQVLIVSIYGIVNTLIFNGRKMEFCGLCYIGIHIDGIE